MKFPYEAFTEACSFGLDETGVCVSVTAKPGASAAMLAIAGRCLGAQYVASLDASVDGLLAPLPKPGTRLLFARTEESGRIVLVRSGPLEHFISREEEATKAAMEAVTEVATEAATEEQTPTSELLTVRAVEVDMEAPRTRSFQEDETAPFSRTRPFQKEALEELAAVTRRSPSTVRAFPPPPAARRSVLPLVRARSRQH